MKVMLFDNMETPPRSKAGHIIVYSGFCADEENQTVTYIDCVYDISGHIVEFRKNADLNATRFEDALNWAVSHAKSIGINEVYAVFTLGRPLDMPIIRGICPEGFVDCRRYLKAPEEKPVTDLVGATPGWASLKPALGSRLRRNFTIGNCVTFVGDA